MASVNDKIMLAIITVVNSSGELTTDEVIVAVRELDGFEDIEPNLIARQVTRLDRDGKLTRQNQLAGWQITATGKGSLDGLRAKMEARYIAPYANWIPVEAVYTLISPSLGPITEPGNQGLAKFPRVGDQVILYGRWIAQALQKAAGKGDATIIVDGAGARRTLPDVAWSRVQVKPILFPPTIALTQSVRRPTNDRGQSVGEIIHESLPAGTELRIRASFPSSHFSELYLTNLFGQLEDLGISAAGTGKGGQWGIGLVSSLVYNGREIWPGAIRNAPQSPGAGRTALETVPAGKVTGDQIAAPGDKIAVTNVDALDRVVGSVRTVNGNK